MKRLSDSRSITAFLETPLHPELRNLIGERMTELSEYCEIDISELVNFLVIDPGDRLTLVSQELGFSLDYESKPWEFFTRHEYWLELVYVLSDDGFGIIAYIPSEGLEDLELMNFCAKHARSTEALDP